jgi:CBS domain
MEDGRYRHLPIVDDGKLVGIVSRYDFGGLELERLDEEIGLGAGLTAPAGSADGHCVRDCRSPVLRKPSR